MAIRRQFGVNTLSPTDFQGGAEDANAAQALAQMFGLTNEANEAGRVGFWKGMAPAQAGLGQIAQQRQEQQLAEQKAAMEMQKNLASLFGIRMQTDASYAKAAGDRAANQGLEMWKKQGDWQKAENQNQAYMQRLDKQLEQKSDENAFQRQTREDMQKTSIEAKAERQQALLDQKKAEADQRRVEKANQGALNALKNARDPMQGSNAELNIATLVPYVFDADVEDAFFKDIQKKAVGPSGDMGQARENAVILLRAYLSRDPKQVAQAEMAVKKANAQNQQEQNALGTSQPGVDSRGILERVDDASSGRGSLFSGSSLTTPAFQRPPNPGLFGGFSAQRPRYFTSAPEPQRSPPNPNTDYGLLSYLLGYRQ